ncbi:nucleotide-binding universal stress UspA family protein [Paraburkholderia sp. Cpub6]|nr:nucleotide-binding universal stress UspA family protein [Paraburkholderia sp. Cpub6]
MSYKSILVHLDTSARAHLRLEIASHLAHRFHARLTGLFSSYVPPRHAFLVRAGTADYYAESALARLSGCFMRNSRARKSTFSGSPRTATRTTSCRRMPASPI